MPRDGLVSWFESRNAAPNWISSVGEQPYEGMHAGGTVKVSTEKGDGAAMPVQYIHGDTTSAFIFGKVIWKHFTICSISRYTGAHQKKVLVGETPFKKTPDWVHGHNNGNTGVATYGGTLVSTVWPNCI